MVDGKANESWSLAEVNQLNSVLALLLPIVADIVTVEILWLLPNVMRKLMALIDTLSLTVTPFFFYPKDAQELRLICIHSKACNIHLQYSPRDM